MTLVAWPQPQFQPPVAGPIRHYSLKAVVMGHPPPLARRSAAEDLSEQVSWRHMSHCLSAKPGYRRHRTLSVHACNYRDALQIELGRRLVLALREKTQVRGSPCGSTPRRRRPGPHRVFPKLNRSMTALAIGIQQLFNVGPGICRIRVA
jgi:hypothetical protein